MYTGITNDLEKRLKAHASGKGAKYTRSRLPLKLVFQMQLKTKSEALKKEVEIKKLSREQKLKLILTQSS